MIRDISAEPRTSRLEIERALQTISMIDYLQTAVLKFVTAKRTPLHDGPRKELEESYLFNVQFAHDQIMHTATNIRPRIDFIVSKSQKRKRG